LDGVAICLASKCVPEERYLIYDCDALTETLVSLAVARADGVFSSTTDDAVRAQLATATDGPFLAVTGDDEIYAGLDPKDVYLYLALEATGLFQCSGGCDLYAACRDACAGIATDSTATPFAAQESDCTAVIEPVAQPPTFRPTEPLAPTAPTSAPVPSSVPLPVPSSLPAVAPTFALAPASTVAPAPAPTLAPTAAAKNGGGSSGSSSAIILVPVLGVLAGLLFLFCVTYHRSRRSAYAFEDAFEDSAGKPSASSAGESPFTGNDAKVLETPAVAEPMVPDKHAHEGSMAKYIEDADL
jgi:hypothetical protein